MNENNTLKTAIDMEINGTTDWIFYTKEEIQNFITEIKQNAALEAKRLKFWTKLSSKIITWLFIGIS